MLLASWFHVSKTRPDRQPSRSRSPPDGARKRPARGSPCGHRLEFLEDRSVPSTLTVLNNLDTARGRCGPRSLAAHNADSIVFASPSRARRSR